jgi:cytochrome P450
VVDISGLPPVEEFDAYPHRTAAAYRPRVGAEYRQDQQVWLVFRHRDVATLLRDPTCRKDPRAAVDGPYGEPLLEGDYSILFMDDPDHQRIRRLVTQAFSKRAVEEYRSRTRAIVDQLLDALESTKDAVDLISALAVPLPIVVIAEILGIDPADQDEFKRWSDDMALSFDESLTAEEAERVAFSGAELRGYIAEVIEARRTHPRQDLISALVAAQGADGSSLSDAEAVSVIALLLFGGNTTTTDLIGNGILALLQHPEQLALLQAEPGLLGNTVEEILRYDPSITLAERIPTTSLEVDGSAISQGEWMCLLLSSANRDPAAHTEPEAFDIRRAPINHVSFGGGKHYCLGAALARMETEVAIDSLITRFPNLRLAEPQCEPSRKRVPGFHGLCDLLVRLD